MRSRPEELRGDKFGNYVGPRDPYLPPLQPDNRECFAHQLMAKAALEAFHYWSRWVRTAGEALEKRLLRLLIVRASATTH